jgi:hypothetical protein
MSALLEEPFFYLLTDPIEAQINAENVNGQGSTSPLSESGVILTERPSQLSAPTYTSENEG